MKPKAKRFEVVDAEPGLYLIVQPSGRRTWAVRYRFESKSQKLTLGPIARLAAVERTRAALADVAIGINPARAKDEPAASVMAAMKRYREQHVSTLREGTRKYVERTLDQLAEALDHGRRPLASVRRADVIAFIDKADAPSSKNLRWKVSRAFFAWCESKDLIEASAGRGIKRPVKETRRERVLSDEELAAVWRAADAATDARHGRLVKMLILTGSRRHEMSELRWSEVKADAIELPGERTKNATPHRVPLTRTMRAVIEACPRSGDYVFGGEYAVTNSDRVTKSLHGLDDLPHWTLHDLRRSAATGMARLGVPVATVEKCLNHRSGTFSGIVSVYQTYDFRREVADAFELWSKHIEKLYLRS